MADLDVKQTRLLLYCETRCVDYGGLLDHRHINTEDRAVLKTWDRTGYVKSGRVALEFVGGSQSIWCRLSEDAWTEAHRQRRLRAERMFKDRRWRGTIEIRGEATIS